ncbi:hypothetical protein [Spirochaeta cellobiosiphila]|uniref:hypothetical protein n=1 Tax=Spirochaeta cellobiosiphila TaxID=504483 RepID=UPI00040B4D01|nr:hypothetical protein [Spirochaeta cellobiosiphila]
MNRKLGIILLLLIPYFLFSGDLDDFERDINKQNPPSSPQKDNSGTDGCWDGCAEGCFHIMGIIVFAGVDYSMMRSGMKSSHEDLSVIPRKVGEPLLPLIQVSTLGQYLGTDKVEMRNQVELGIGPVAFRYRGQNIFEGYDDTLFTHQFLGILRVSLGNKIEWGLGSGLQLFYGNRERTGLVLTMPIKIGLTDHLFLDMTPNMISQNNTSSALYEGEALLSYHRGSLALRGGWGWFGNSNAMLTGPVLGLAFTL